jgi:N-methylhydantoinase B/oxoprolinase/acetone carboxylase alpha subunit
LVDRTIFAAQGLMGGEPGSLLKMRVDPPRTIPPKDYILLQPGDVFTIELPGGGGYGSSEKRRRELTEKDVRLGLVTVTKE